MRNLFTFITALFFCSVGFAQLPEGMSVIQEVDLPPEVIEGYHRVHQDHPAKEWRVFNDIYQVEYVDNGLIMYDRYNDEGLYLETRTRLNWEKSAPQQLVDSKQRTMYKYYDVTDYFHVETSDDDEYYILHLKGENNETQTLYFDEDGTLREKTKSGR
jgi:hypothetical protein